MGGDGTSPGFNYGSLHGKSKSQEGVVTPSHTRKVADEIPKGFNGGGGQMMLTVYSFPKVLLKVNIMWGPSLVHRWQKRKNRLTF
ncbi:hypothetical protein Hanom_Chr02g00151351 [Helianthus anomalus]